MSNMALKSDGQAGGRTDNVTQVSSTDIKIEKKKHKLLKTISQ